jgi:hypothetical protein
MVFKNVTVKILTSRHKARALRLMSPISHFILG